VVAPVATVVAGLVAYAWVARPRDAPVLSGYVEGEALYLAAPVSGPLASLAVVRGQRVKAGDPLFRVDPRPIAAQHAQSVSEVAQAEAQVEAARGTLTQLEAAASAARVLADNAEVDAGRFANLVRNGSGAVSRQDADRAVANAAAARAQAAAATAQVAAARAQAAAATEGAERARGGLADVSVRLAYLSPTAPTAARVEEVFFQAGEWVPANQAIVSLLPDDRVRLRFFVPETVVARYRPGRTVRFACDGCGLTRSAVINYVSPRPEYTPPVIYSRRTRDSLVYLVEARPQDAARLTPGLPVDVTPVEDAP